MGKGARGYTNLNVFLRYDKICYLAVCKGNTQQKVKNDPTGCILSPTIDVLFVVVIRDKNGGRSYTVGINSGLKIIYECMENHEQNLNKENLNKCCEQDCEFQIFCVAAELRDNKVHAKNSKN